MCLALAAQARSEPSVVINEVLYDAEGADGGREWVELFNVGTEEAELEGWRIERGGAAFVQVFTFPSGATLAPESFLVVGEASVPEAQLPASLAFQNGGSATDGIRLVDHRGRVADALLYDAPNTNGLPDETGAPGASLARDVAEGHSLGRIPDGADTNQSASDFFDVALPTPGQRNHSSSSPSVPAVSPSPSPRTPTANVASIVVNEALPNPVGADAAGEFIELFNMSSSPAELKGFRLDDGEGGSNAYVIPPGTQLDAGGYRAFSGSETKIALNNDGDAVRLLAPGGEVIHALTYGSVPGEGVSWIRSGDGTAEWSSTPTPGAPNVRTPLPQTERGTKAPSPRPTSTPGAHRSPSSSPRPASTSPRASPRSQGAPAAVVDVSLLAARALPPGTRLRTSGRVTTPPGVLGKGVFSIADVSAGQTRSSGIHVVVSEGEPPSLAVGDQVALQGVVSRSRGEFRLRARGSDIRSLGTRAPVDPMEMTTGRLGEDVEGMLVQVRGTVLRRSGNAFTLDDDSGPARVVVKKTTGWTLPPLSRGARVRVTGIVSQAGDTYRILPRFLEDLLVERVGSAQTSRSAKASNVSQLSSRSGVERAQKNTKERGESDVSPEVPSNSYGSDQRAAPPSPNASSSRLGISRPALLAWSVAGLLVLIRFFFRRGSRSGER